MKRKLMTVTLMLLGIKVLSAFAGPVLNQDEKFYASHMDEILKVFHEEAGYHDAVPTEYALIDIDDDGIKELWVRNTAQEEESFFCRGGGKLQHICHKMYKSSYSLRGTVFCTGLSAGTGAYYRTYAKLKNSSIETFYTVMDTYGPYGEEHNCEKDGEPYSADALDSYIASLPEPTEFSAMFIPIERISGEKVDMSNAGGMYSYSNDRGEGSIYVLTDGKGNATFTANACTSRGNFADLAPEDAKYVKLDGNVLKYKYQYSDTQSYTVTMEFYGDKMYVTEQYEGSPALFGLGAGLWGTYEKNPNYFCDSNSGYMFSTDPSKPGTCAVAKGGLYRGDVTIPAKVKSEGFNFAVCRVDDYAMCGGYGRTADMTSLTLPSTVNFIGKGAFSCNANLKSIKYGNPDVTVSPEAYMDCPSLSVDDLQEPLFAVVNEARDVFIFPTEDITPDYSRFKWGIFKQNIAQVRYNGMKNLGKESAMACFHSDFSKIMGAQYLPIDKSVVPAMFRGYTRFEIMMLLCSNGFVGTHSFPAYSRWKHPEPEVPISASLQKKLSKMFDDRQVAISRKVAKLRNGNEELVMVEFAPRNNEYVVVFAWVTGDTIIATYKLFTEIDPEYGTDHIWNVDDDGCYGCPQVINIAIDDKYSVELFLVHSAPESRTLMHLKQQGDKFVLVSEDMWYVYND